jgi:glycosyltransferase involved in cell wall biosynthesis
MAKTDNILISVILSVRNGERFIREAVESVLRQTYSHFELLIVNDGSTDGTNAVLQSFNDDRINIIETEGVGLVKALNLGISKANGEYIARMDADDICMPERFAKEVEVLNNNEHIGLVCSDIEVIDEDGKRLGFQKEVINNRKKLLKALSFKGNMKPIIHPTVMMRKSLIDSIGGYREYDAAEDRDLWLRLATITNFFRISTHLLKYRYLKTSVSRSKYFVQNANSVLAVLNHEIKNDLGVDLYQEFPEILKHFYKEFYNSAKETERQYVNFQLQKQNYATKTGLQKIFALMKIIADYNNLSYYFLQQTKKRYLIKNAQNKVRKLLNLLNKLNTQN